MEATASAPASSGNLGPGFDTVALALDLRCTVEAERSDAFTVEEGRGVETLDEGDLVARAVDAAVGRPMHLRIRNDIPRARGLGSSSAVAAAAAAACLAATDVEVRRDHVFEIVGRLEGHEDNAAAAVYGGLVAVSDGAVAHLRIDRAIVAIIAIPDATLATTRARAALPRTIATETAVRSLGRLAFLLEGLRTADPRLLAAAAGDELHEEPRSPLSPVTGRLVETAVAAGALHAAWSGAGPAAIAFATEATESDVRSALSDVLGPQGRVERVPVDHAGLR